MPNRLQHEKSPYLLQHRENPVDWWSWGEAAFEEARTLDRPVFLSIGYSTCHWCHVMAHESFEDEEVARLMNGAFVNIKVDREERPDVDNVYMTVCQMMTGGGGWPLTIVMTPDKKPFFAATYIPRRSRHGRPGMMELIPLIEAAWRERREQVVATAEEVTGILRQAAAAPAAERGLDRDVWHRAYAHLRQRFDPQHGGFGEAPKFPSPHTLLFLLRYGHRTGEEAALGMVEATLAGMRRGGIYDHLGFGFHRYATDAAWVLPHFEKMLYDQALLVMAYLDAYEATRLPAYAETAREVLTYVLRDMTDPEGGFYSAEDADSDGREGAFYVWTYEELHARLDPELADLVTRVFNVEERGNFEEEATRRKTGENVLYRSESLSELAETLGLEEGRLRERLERARRVLYAARERRERPGRDDKILTDWNGLMIAALARAGRVLGETAYTSAGERAATFLLATMRRPDGRLLHRYRDGEAALDGTLDDYAYVVWGLLELYETTFDVAYLSEALTLNDLMRRHFLDEAHGAFFFAADDAETLIARHKEAYDGAQPSGNSVAMLNLLRLARLTGRVGLEEQADAVGRYFADAVRKQPAGFTAMLLALGFALGPAYEVVIAGDPEADDTKTLIRALRTAYVPNKVVLLRPPGEAPPITALAPYTRNQRPVSGRATAYVCRKYQCEQPTTDASVMLHHLGARLEER